MPALTAVKFELLFTQLYIRVYKKSGIKMKGYVAVQRKLLQLVYHLWKNSEAFKRKPENTSGNDESKPLFLLQLVSSEKK